MRLIDLDADKDYLLDGKHLVKGGTDYIKMDESAYELGYTHGQMSERDTNVPQGDTIIRAKDDIAKYRTWSQTYDNMCSDFISRQAAIGVIDGIVADATSHGIYPRLAPEYVKDVLASLPSADAVPLKVYAETADENMTNYNELRKLQESRPTGKWRADERAFTTGTVWCSNCEREYYMSDLYDVGGGYEYPNFCPNCGARMGGAE